MARLRKLYPGPYLVVKRLEGDPLDSVALIDGAIDRGAGRPMGIAEDGPYWTSTDIISGIMFVMEEDACTFSKIDEYRELAIRAWMEKNEIIRRGHDMIVSALTLMMERRIITEDDIDIYLATGILPFQEADCRMATGVYGRKWYGRKTPLRDLSIRGADLYHGTLQKAGEHDTV